MGEVEPRAAEQREVNKRHAGCGLDLRWQDITGRLLFAVVLSMVLLAVQSGCGGAPQTLSQDPTIEPETPVATPSPPATEQIAVFAAEDVVGFDVSHHQGDVAWSRVPADQFVFIKASEGVDYQDPKFVENWQSARQHGVLRGAYHMFRPEDDVDQQVEFFVGLLHKHDFDARDLPPALDLESNSGTAEVSAAQLRQRAEQWLVAVAARLGRTPLVYTNPSFWQGELEPEHDLVRFPLWVAAYTDAQQPPELVDGWPEWTFWQHTEDGSLAGIAQPVDLNRFNGTGEDLKQFVSEETRP